VTILFGIIAGASFLATVTMAIANWTRLRNRRLRLSSTLIHPAPPEVSARLSLVLYPLAVGVIDTVLLTALPDEASLWALVAACSFALAVGEATSLRNARPIPQNPLGWQPKPLDLRLPTDSETPASHQEEA
jgi:hypothetical protein